MSPAALVPPDYVETIVWRNRAAPALSAENLNAQSQAQADYAVAVAHVIEDWTDAEFLSRDLLGVSVASTTENVNTVAAAGAAKTLPDVTSDTIHDLTLTAACTLTFPTAAAGKSFTLVLRQDGTGSRLVTWPGSVKWPNGVAPTLSTAVNAVDLLTFICSDGTHWLGSLAGNSYA